MRVIIILSCLATLAVCIPIGNHGPIHQRHVRRRPHIVHIKPKHEKETDSPREEIKPIQVEKEPSVLDIKPAEIIHPEFEIKPVEANEPEPISTPKPEIKPAESKSEPEIKPIRRKWEPSEFQKLPALMHEEVHDEYGQYALRFVTADNTVVSERGQLVPSPNGGYVLEIEGKYQFVGDDGQLYYTEYKGGKDGFSVSAKHLPVPVPMPAI